jgi:hypothetical protein
MDELFDGLGTFDWDDIERVTIEPSTEDAKATHLRNSLLGVTLSRDLKKDTDCLTTNANAAGRFGSRRSARPDPGHEG